jgi:hypothetical protein
MKAMYRLISDQIRAMAIRDVRMAPDGHYVTIKEPTRSLDQNSLLHALLQSLEGKEWAGKPRTLEEWKVLMVSGHALATGRQVEVVEGLEGEPVNIRESTALMTVARLNSLIEYVQAWISEHESQEAP